MIRPMVVGLGSHHGDDQAGWIVLERLKSSGYPENRLCQAHHAADLLDVVNHEQPLVICDACVGSGSAATIHLLRWPSDELIYQRASSSHDLPLSDVLELGTKLGCLPHEIRIWIMEGHNFTPGASPSTEIQSAAARLAEQIACGD